MSSASGGWPDVWSFAIALVAFVVAIVLIMRLLIWWTTSTVKNYVESRNRAAEAIADTGRPPDFWTHKLKLRIERLRSSPEGLAKARRVEERAKRICLRKVSKLMAYFKSTTLVEDEETRKILLDELQRAYDSWEKKNWEEMVSPGETQPGRVVG
jgi:hypothetical protein